MFAASKTAVVSGAGPDDKFNYVTILLHGDGTNGAQNNTFVDSSSNNFTITRNGNTTQGSFSPYGSNWSNFFDGSGDYLATSSTQIIPSSTTYTVEAWVYLTGDYSDYREIVTQGSSGNANRWLMFINITDGILGIQTGASSITTSFTVPRNTWTHLAFVNNSGSYTVYANGTSVGSGTNTVTPQNTYVTVGAFQSGAEYFQGYISNVRITNTAVYTSAFTPSTTPLTAISGTSFLTCQSNRFIDNSANTYAITVYGNSSVQRFNPFGASTAYSTSVIGGSGYFDGSGDYLGCGSQSAYAFGTSNFTMECWAYATSFASYNGLTGSRTSSGDSTSTNYSFGIDSGGSVYFYSGSFLVTSSAGAIKLNSWNHIAIVRSGTGSNQSVLYINGVSAGTGTISNNLSGTSFAIGGLVNGDEPFTGYITNVRLNNTALYSTTFTPPTAPLTAVSGTSLLTNMINGAIFDNAMINNLETVGNAQISTSVKKYGTGSLAFDGTGDYLVSAPSPNNILGGGDFTIEFWLYPNNTTSSYRALVSSENYNPSTTGGWSLYQIGDKFELWIVPSNIITSTASITASVWQHVALTRASGTLRLFVNGSSVGTASNSTSLTGQKILIGDNLGSYFYNGYIDDLRITKGYARYTTTFTPPTSALSDTGPY